MPRPLAILAAGSLKAALLDYAATLADRPDMAFGPAGLLRQAIEEGRRCDVFLSANTAHPAALGGTVVTFARNPLCIAVRAGLEIGPGTTAATLVDLLLDPGLRLGTSTPGADPSGDYAQEMLGRAEAIRPGAAAALRAKAMAVVGSAIPGRDAPGKEAGIAGLFAAGAIDAFIGYRSSLRLLSPELEVVAPPTPLGVVATYALIVLVPGHNAERFVSGLLGEAGQALLARHGFDPVPGGLAGQAAS